MSEIVEKKIIFKTIVKPWGDNGLIKDPSIRSIVGKKVTVTIDVDDGPVKTPQVV